MFAKPAAWFGAQPLFAPSACNSCQAFATNKNHRNLKTITCTSLGLVRSAIVCRRLPMPRRKAACPIPSCAPRPNASPTPRTRVKRILDRLTRPAGPCTWTPLRVQLDTCVGLVFSFRHRILRMYQISRIQIIQEKRLTAIGQADRVTCVQLLTLKPGRCIIHALLHLRSGEVDSPGALLRGVSLR